jgi:hypothetical protein
MAWASVQTIADMWAQSQYPPQANRQHHPVATDAVASANAEIKDDKCREKTQEQARARRALQPLQKDPYTGSLDEMSHI